MTKSTYPISILGLSIITSNEEAFKENTIGKLWDRFLESSIKEKLNNIISPHVYAVYSDYEDGFKRNYKITIGYAVQDLHHIPTGLTSAIIPAGKYQIYKAGKSPEEIIGTWQKIWAISSTKLPRNFIADFEEYSDEGVAIHIGYK